MNSFERGGQSQSEHRPIDPESLKINDPIWDKSATSPIQGKWELYSKETLGDTELFHLVRPDTRESVIRYNLLDFAKDAEAILADIAENYESSQGSYEEVVEREFNKAADNLIKDYMSGFANDSRRGGIRAHRAISMSFDRYEQFNPALINQESLNQIGEELEARLKMGREAIANRYVGGSIKNKAMVDAKLNKFLNETLAYASRFHGLQLLDPEVRAAAGKADPTDRTKEFVEEGYKTAPSTMEVMEQAGIDPSILKRELNQAKKREAKLKKKLAADTPKRPFKVKVPWGKSRIEGEQVIPEDDPDVAIPQDAEPPEDGETHENPKATDAENKDVAFLKELNKLKPNQDAKDRLNQILKREHALLVEGGVLKEKGLNKISGIAADWELKIMTTEAQDMVVAGYLAGEIAPDQVTDVFDLYIERSLDRYSSKLAMRAFLRDEQSALVVKSGDEGSGELYKRIQDQASENKSDFMYWDIKAHGENRERSFARTEINLIVKRAQQAVQLLELVAKLRGADDSSIDLGSAKVTILEVENKLQEALRADQPENVVPLINEAQAHIESLVLLVEDDLKRLMGEVPPLVQGDFPLLSDEEIAAVLAEVTKQAEKGVRLHNLSENLKGILGIAAAGLIAGATLYLINTEQAAREEQSLRAHPGFSAAIEKDPDLKKLEQSGESTETIATALFYDGYLLLSWSLEGEKDDRLTATQAREAYDKLQLAYSILGEEAFNKLAEQTLAKDVEDPGKYILELAAKIAAQLELAEADRDTGQRWELSPADRFLVEDIKSDWAKLHKHIASLDSLKTKEEKLKLLRGTIKPLADELTNDYNELSVAAQAALLHELWGDFIGKDQLKISSKYPTSEIQEDIQTLIRVVEGVAKRSADQWETDSQILENWPQGSDAKGRNLPRFKQFFEGRDQDMVQWKKPDTNPPDPEGYTQPQFGVGRDQEMFNVKPNPDEGGDDALGRAA